MTPVNGPSARINRFLAREPPDGCEKVTHTKPLPFTRLDFTISLLQVCLKQTDADQLIQPTPLYKPTGFKLIPSSDSAFQPIGMADATGTGPSTDGPIP